MKQGNSSSKIVTLRLDPTTIQTLSALAEADRRPFATFLAMILKDYAKARGPKPRRDLRLIVSQE